MLKIKNSPDFCRNCPNVSKCVWHFRLHTSNFIEQRNFNRK